MKTKLNPIVIVTTVLTAVVVVIVGVALMNLSLQNEAKKDALSVTSNLIGKPLPDMMLYDKDSKPFPLESLKGKKAILFFNEGIMCYPACWDQIAALATDERFNNDNVVAYSVVMDQPKDWDQAKEKMPDIAKAKFLFDLGGMASQHLGLLNAKSSMHAGSMPGHTYVLVDQEGVVKDILDDPNMANNNDKVFDLISKF